MIQNYTLLENDQQYQIFMEDIFHNPLMPKLESLFKELMDNYIIKDDNGKYKRLDLTSKSVNDIFTKIENTFNRIFNTQLSLFVEPSESDRLKLQYCAMITVEEKDIKDALNNLEDFIKKEQSGYYFAKVNKARIAIQEDFMRFLKSNDELDHKNLVAVILHEIGHKIYLKLNIQIEEKYNKKIARISLFGRVIASVGLATMVGGSIAVTEGEVKGGLIAILSGIILILFSVPFYVWSLALDAKSYSKTEGNCDSMAVQYGYGKEIYILFCKFELLSYNYLSTKKKFIRNIFNTDYKRRKIIYNNIKKEISNPNNSERDKKQLKEILKYINDYLDENT